MRYSFVLINKYFLFVIFLFKGSHLFSGSEMPFPIDLYGIPFADKQGIILDVKNVPVRDIKAPYNAALIKGGNWDYLLIFRYDIKKKWKLKNNYIGCVELDKNFEQKEDFKNIDTTSNFSNDPRLFKAGSRFFLVYNDIVSLGSRDRIIKIAELDVSNFQLNYITDLDRKIKKTEKNWTPFSYQNNSAEEIYFIYTIDPQIVLKLENPRENKLKDINFDSNPINFPWYWGIPRGGTHAELIDGEYLSFFHSSFTDRNGKHWYVMGAFTFEANPPFRVTGVSPHPLLFKGIYSSPHSKGSSSRLRCIFPTGLVLSEDDSKILVSCGENDSAVKIITFDKKALLKSLIRTDPRP
jgi:predicted GH43/DUF377 family glycosyl hydrolase